MLKMSLLGDVKKFQRSLSPVTPYFKHTGLAILTLMLCLTIIQLFQFMAIYSSESVSLQTTVEESENYVINDYGPNDKLIMKRDRYNDTPVSELKTILFWNDAYGNRDYDIGHGREPFYRFKCPETRCIATADRKFLPSVDQFDAVLIHQRGIDWKDMPVKRSPKQRWIHWVMESAQYIAMDITTLNGKFNWTMTYKRNSDFYLPYATIHKVKEHPEGEELDRYIKAFGKKNAEKFARGRKELKAAWFVSHCATQGRREKMAKAMSKMMTVDIYGKCGKKQCSRKNETECYVKAEGEYKFYLSFENSICDDYVTEKFFNILKYDMIPVVFGGTDYSAIAPKKSYINALDFKTPKRIVNFLR